MSDTARIDQFEKMLAGGHDSPLLRFSLGRAYFQTGQNEQAVQHLQMATELDPEYSAAWKELGRVLAADEQADAAAIAWTRGIEVAEAAGDKQAAKEMRVFLRRVQEPRR